MGAEHGKVILQSITCGDGERVLEFFANFSRFEYAMKRAGYVKSDRYGNALADWAKFAEKHKGRLDAIMDENLREATQYLRGTPPERQVLNRLDNNVQWRKNSPRGGESEEQYVLRLVRDVRNNLFHGAKYSTGHVNEEELRNSRLLDACVTILDRCRLLDNDVDRYFGPDE